MKNSALAALLLFGACSAETDEPLPVAAEEEALSAEVTAPVVVSQSVTGGQVTVSGRVFYNDRRNDGLFAARRTPSGAVGTRCNTQGLRDDGTACSVNWLGAQYMVVDIYEVDLPILCKWNDLQTSVAVAYDGRWSATFTPTEGCGSEAGDPFVFMTKVRARYCGDWCASLNRKDHDPYTLIYPNSLSMRAGDDVDIGDLYFYPRGESSTTPGLYAKAANYYASLVDTTLTVHRDAGIPFYKAEFGEVEYIFPSTETATATTKSPSRVVIRVDEEVGWEDGKTSAHEYGHVMMLRAWDGDYGFDGIGISANDTEIAPSRQIAFKEAYAEFLARAVFPLTRGCDRASFDDNASTPLPGALGEGAQWRLNVTKALCDWYDTRGDDDLSLAGAGDHFAAENLYSMWQNLRNMYVTADQYGGDYDGEGLWFCDFLDYYLNVRKSVSAVGAAAHDDYVDWLTDLVYQNNIGCYLPAP